MKEDFVWLAGEMLPKMRLVVEGAVQRYENDVLGHAAQPEAKEALNDVATALYILRANIAELQTAYTQAANQT